MHPKQESIRAVQDVLDKRDALNPQDVGGFIIRVDNQWDVLSRACQVHIQNQMYELWLKGPGKHWHEHVLDAYYQRDPNAPEPSNGYITRKLKAHYKTHNDKVCGGEIWQKILIAYGGIPPMAVSMANLVAAKRF